jgi:hypothetical protein
VETQTSFFLGFLAFPNTPNWNPHAIHPVLLSTSEAACPGKVTIQTLRLLKVDIMQITSPVKITRRNFHTMRSRAFRPIAAILSVLLLAGSPVHAGPVAISEVLQVIGSHQNPPELRLRSLQTAATPISAAIGSRTDSRVDQSDSGNGDIIDSSTVDAGSDTLLAGVNVGTVDPQGGVDVIDQGNLEGTICDCGEITVPGGGFPKWPLLFLAAIPFFFIHGCDDCESSTPTPTPTPPDTPVPEPASLLLFGSGLAAFGAGLRRRYARSKLTAQVGQEG